MGFMQLRCNTRTMKLHVMPYAFSQTVLMPAYRTAMREAAQHHGRRPQLVQQNQRQEAPAALCSQGKGAILEHKNTREAPHCQPCRSQPTPYFLLGSFLLIQLRINES